jgi:hypothetical protein
MCTKLDADSMTTSPCEEKNVLCTKVELVKWHLKLAALTPTLQASFASVNMGWLKGVNIFCELWKSTMCRSGRCMVKKEVKCANVCPSWNNHLKSMARKNGSPSLVQGEPQYRFDKGDVYWSKCDKSLCQKTTSDKQRLGALACSGPIILRVLWTRP